LPKKQKTPYLKAVLLGIGIGFLLVLITPKCLDVETKSGSTVITTSSDPEFTFVIDSLKAAGFAVENHYPVYIRLIKRRVDGEIVSHAMSIAKSLKTHTGNSVKVQIDANGGSVTVDPDRGIINPSEIIVR